MRINQPKLAGLLATAFVFLLTASVGGLAQNPAQMVPNGQSFKIQGIVIDRKPDSFRVRDTSNVETIVILTPATEVRTHRHGVFGGGKPYAATYILRGLRLQAEGLGNADGALVAKLVKFDEQDLRTAQALQQTDEMTRENQVRIAAEEQARKEEAQKLAGQIAENQALTAQAQASADAANARAEAAQKTADRANNRINGLNDYDPVRNWTIYFRPGSAILSLAEKQKIDAGVAWVRAQPNTDAWFVEIVGFADTTGNTAYNRSLSERRANAVIGYLVAKHNLPLTRLIQPFGYGDSKPVANNRTASGRALNRRVEIKILANKGIAGKTD
jgi:outer membrane protein OmpA-like peptidoglycan-associated protein